MAAVLGIDMSLTNTGLCIRVNGKTILNIAVKTPSEMPWDERITLIYENIFELIQLHKVDLVVIENYSFGSTFGRELLGEIHGVIMYDLFRRGIRFLKVPPTQVKLFGCGRGSAPKRPEGAAKSTWAKRWVVEETNKRYDTNFRLVDNDKCDAYLIALLAETLLLVEENVEILNDLPSHQDEVVRKILNIPKPKKSRRKKDG